MSSQDDLDTLEAQLTTERRKVDVANHNFSVRELVRMMTDEELNVAPEYQRKFRWTEDGESLFIESVFLGLPIPPIFVATNVGFQWEVVDGLQRLSSLLHFMGESTEDLKFANRREPLILEGLEKLNQLNGRTFAELPKSLQVYFGRQPLQVISLTDKSDLQVRFDLFERLNRGTVTLTAQEVRACVYRGPFNNFLEELAADETFLSLLKLQRARQHDGTKAEQVLKFFAYKNYRDEFDGKVSGFCNRYMQHAQSNFDYKRERQRFLDAVQTLSAICKGRPFVRPGISLTPLVQFEACLVAVAELQEEGAEIAVPTSDWLRDEELKASSTGATNTRAMLRRRIDRAKVLLGARS
ncbi:DUF262 domain-containing protein [Micromonospora sp. GCM10011542]|uniref:DUF262 domain-containing protein n=1 Tax=Micromonospora sp. GCM10011542 TaxID=3317337 RepID=UPI00360FAD1B